MNNNHDALTIQDIQIGQDFHCKRYSRHSGPRTMGLVGVSESGAFLVRCNNQVNIFINANAPIVLAEESNARPNA